MQKRRVVVTGVGLVSPTGVGTEEAWSAIRRGESGIGPISLFDASDYACKIAGEVRNFDPLRWFDKKDLKKTARFIHFGVAAAEMAIEQSGLVVAPEIAERVGVFIGSGIGGFEVIEREHSTYLERGPHRISPFFFPAILVNIAAGRVSMRLGAKGPNSSVATACSTGAHSIGEAYRIVARGEAEVMIGGGSEATVTPLAVGGFVAMRALSSGRNDEPTRASRPWDRDRDGFVVGEGAGVLVLEEREFALARGAKILAELVGYGMNSDAYHISAPPEDGAGVFRVMTKAMKDAGVGPAQVQYVNAHATSTPQGDVAEARAIERVFAGHTGSVAISSTKSMTGHLLGGAGALEAGITVLALRDQIAPPTINLDNPDDGIQLDLVPHHARPMPIEYAMSNSFGFGGTNACLVFRKAD
jgi:3-oxoacyl-[acyl-carrier-protein] synthase II